MVRQVHFRGLMDATEFLSEIELFGQLNKPALQQLGRSLQTIRVAADSHLVSRGDPADAIYFVLSGLFDVCIDDDVPSGIEIGRGQPVGEIGFFAGMPRTASVIAKRDSVVLALGRREYEELVAGHPQIKDRLIHSLSQRLFDTTERLDGEIPFSPARVVTVFPIGSQSVPNNFIASLLDALKVSGSARVVDRVSTGISKGRVNLRSELALWLEKAAIGTDILVLRGDPADPQWTQIALENSDEILLVGDAADKPAPLPCETQFAPILSKRRTRIVLLHHTRKRFYPNTRRWLDARPPAPHHHIAARQGEDYHRLARFLKGSATGLVTCGGGAFCAAHIGIYKAFWNRGIGFDYYGGTSGGGAMAAAFANQLDPDEISDRLHDIFITRASLGKITIPRYSLIDHTWFDDALRANYGDVFIEDLAIPFFAIATDLTDGNEVSLRRGLLWEAVRATGSIPGLLPPFMTKEGRILIDGSLSNNVPVSAMHREKAGPNIVVDFGPPAESFTASKYENLPGRWKLASAYLLPFGKESLPDAPRLKSVIVRAMMMSRQKAETGDNDRVMAPPLPSGMNVLDWSRHRQIANSAFEYANGKIDTAMKANDAVYAAVLETAQEGRD